MASRKERLDLRRFRNPAPKELKLAPLTEEDERRIQEIVDDWINSFATVNRFMVATIRRNV